MKLYFKFLILILSFILFQNCGSSIDAAKIAETRELVDSRKFEIQHEWLSPMSGNRINLIGNPNYIRFYKDSVDLFLPFFGERFAGAGYNDEGGIVYEGPLKDLQINEEEKDKQVIRFSTDQDTEDLNFIITVYPGGKVNTRVNSSHRSFISYQGEIESLKEEED